MTTFSSQVILSIFFLYVVIISEKLFSLISCNFQKIIETNRYFKQLLILINIFLFTFILGWYTEQSIYSAKETYNYSKNYEYFENINNEYFENINNKNTFFELYKNEFKIIGKYILFSLIIYIIFMLTTKCEIKYLTIFFTIIIFLFFLFLLRTYSKNKYYDNTEFKIIDFISNKKKYEKLKELEIKLKDSNIPNNIKQKILTKFKINMNIQNIEFCLFIISLIALFIGFIKYFNRQKREYNKDWDLKIFFLGKYKCSTKKK